MTAVTAGATTGHDRRMATARTTEEAPMMFGLETLAVAALLHLPAEHHDWMRPSRSAPSAAVSFGGCVIRHESANAGGPRAENSRSTASGLFQLIDGTWMHYAQHVPSARKYRHASHAPASVQWEVFLLAFKWHGQGNWSGTRCGYGT